MGPIIISQQTRTKLDFNFDFHFFCYFRVNGKIILPTEPVPSLTLMEINMLVIGKRVRKVVMESCITQTATNLGEY